MANAKKSAQKVTAVQQTALDGMTQMASKIRYLSKEGYSRGDISRILEIRYQWVRNVLITPLKNS
jgi:hypothetical protein